LLADATPFQWVATTDSILQKIERIAFFDTFAGAEAFRAEPDA